MLEELRRPDTDVDDRFDPLEDLMPLIDDHFEDEGKALAPVVQKDVDVWVARTLGGDCVRMWPSAFAGA